MSIPLIRRFRPSDTSACIKIFQEAVHAIGIKHYTAEQVAVWAPEYVDEQRWRAKLMATVSFVAEMDGIIVGFADITHSGHFEHLYIHKNYQGRFIALHLLRVIEHTARDLGLTKITTDCSITAKIPAERMGFIVVKKQVVERNGIQLINYRMEKNI